MKEERNGINDLLPFLRLGINGLEPLKGLVKAEEWIIVVEVNCKVRVRVIITADLCEKRKNFWRLLNFSEV